MWRMLSRRFASSEAFRLRGDASGRVGRWALADVATGVFLCACSGVALRPSAIICPPPAALEPASPQRSVCSVLLCLRFRDWCLESIPRERAFRGQKFLSVPACRFRRCVKLCMQSLRRERALDTGARDCAAARGNACNTTFGFSLGEHSLV